MSIWQEQATEWWNTLRTRNKEAEMEDPNAVPEKQEIVAAGGWCAPVETVYDAASLDLNSYMWRIDSDYLIPRARRGGIRYGPGHLSHSAGTHNRGGVLDAGEIRGTSPYLSWTDEGSEWITPTPPLPSISWTYNESTTQCKCTWNLVDDEPTLVAYNSLCRFHGHM